MRRRIALCRLRRMSYTYRVGTGAIARLAQMEKLP